MHVTERKINNNKTRGSKIVKIVLFLSIYIFVVFLSRKIISYPKDNVDFLIKNILSFICAIIITGITIKYFRGKSLKICILIIWIISVLLMITS